jgi:hypothetical protein
LPVVAYNYQGLGKTIENKLQRPVRLVENIGKTPNTIRHQQDKGRKLGKGIGVHPDTGRNKNHLIFKLF